MAEKKIFSSIELKKKEKREINRSDVSSAHHSVDTSKTVES